MVINVGFGNVEDRYGVGLSACCLRHIVNAWPAEKITLLARQSHIGLSRAPSSLTPLLLYGLRGHTYGERYVYYVTVLLCRVAMNTPPRVIADYQW